MGKSPLVERFFPKKASNEFDINILGKTKETISSCDPLAPGQEYRNQIKDALEVAGWSGKVFLEHDSKRYIDGIFEGIGLVVQMGNKGAATSYLMNLEYLFSQGKITSAIFVTQTKKQAIRRYSIGHPNARPNDDGNYMGIERLEADLGIFSAFLRCPICVVAIDC